MKKFIWLCCAAFLFGGCSMLPKSSDTETPDYCYDMGELYFDTDAFSQEIKMAESWYLRAAKRGHVNSMYKLGVLYKDQYSYSGELRDLRRSLKWLRDAAEKQHADAVREIVEIELTFDTEALANTPQKEQYYDRQASTLKFLKEFADKGNMHAKFGVARIYYAKNNGAYHAEALQLLKESSDSGYLPAEFYYARTQKDVDDCVNILNQMSAQKRYLAFAFAKLNEMASEGEFLFTDLAQKEQNLCGLYSPRYRFHYNKKQLTPESIDRIRQTWQIAADKGFWGAQVSLAEEYLTGGSLFPQDVQEGYKWFIIARMNWQNTIVNEDALSEINDISPEDKGAAITDARAWWQKNHTLYSAE